MARIRVSPDGREVAELVAALPSGRFLLGLSGAPGSGKSTLAAALAAAYDAPVVGMDGFHRRDADLRATGRLDAKGAPDTFDAAAYVDLLGRLATAGHDVPAPGFDHGRGDPVPDRVLVPAAAGLVVTEGNYLLLDDPQWPSWAAVRRRLGAVWHLVTDEPVRLERLVDRHVVAGRPPADARAWVDRVDQPNARLVEAVADRADVVLDLTAWSGRVLPR